MKKITINEKEYTIDCNAYTRFLYKKTFGTGIFKDIDKLTKYTQGKEGLLLDNLDEVLDDILQITYILIKTANPTFESYENWLKSLTKIKVSDPWISEVTELAVTSFLG